MKRLTSVAIAIVGIVLVTRSFLFVSQVLSLLDYAGEVGMGSTMWSVIGALATTALTFAVGVALFLGRDKVAARLVGEDGDEPIAVEEPLRVGLVLVGVWLVVSAAPQFVGTLCDWLYREAMASRDQLDYAMGGVRTADYVGAFVRDAVQVLLGASLTLGAGALSRRLWRQAPQVEMTDAAPKPEQTDRCPHCGFAYSPSDYTDMTVARCVECHEPLA